MEWSTEAVAGWALRLPEFGRLRMEADALVMERSLQAKSAEALRIALAGRRHGEALLIQRFPAHWLITFSRIILPLDNPEQSC